MRAFIVGYNLAKCAQARKQRFPWYTVAGAPLGAWTGSKLWGEHPYLGATLGALGGSLTGQMIDRPSFGAGVALTALALWLAWKRANKKSPESYFADWPSSTGIK